MSWEADVELNVVSWNVDGWHTIRDTQLALLESTDADVALLQEVTPASMEALRAAGWTGTSALQLVSDDHTERDGVHPRFACAVLTRDNVTMQSASLIAGAPSQVRGLQAQILVGDRSICAISAALPPGSMWGRVAKVGQAEALAAAIQEAGLPTVIGMDRNGPKSEGWESSETEWWREDPREFFDATATHGCIDVLDKWHEVNPAAALSARQKWPHGPRAVSYVERRADPPIPRRYDVIMATEDVRVTHVDYRYDDAIEAGSDHGLVAAKLAMP